MQDILQEKLCLRVRSSDICDLIKYKCFSSETLQTPLVASMNGVFGLAFATCWEVLSAVDDLLVHVPVWLRFYLFLSFSGIGS